MSPFFKYVWDTVFLENDIKYQNNHETGKVHCWGFNIKQDLKPCTDITSNLLGIDLRLDVQIVCDGLQQKFQYAEYSTCEPLISQPWSPNFQMVSTINLTFSQAKKKKK